MTDFDAEAATWDDKPDRAERSRALAGLLRERLGLDRDAARSLSALEYGSGTGQLSRALAGDLASITLADSSLGMTTVASQRIADEGLASLRAVQLDLVEDPLPGERYDLVFSAMALHHVSDIPHLLECFHALLNPAGRIALIDLDAEGGRFHDAGFTGHHGFHRDVLTDQLTSAGFTDIAFSTAYTVTKEVDGKPEDFPLFLVTARRP